MPFYCSKHNDSKCLCPKSSGVSWINICAQCLNLIVLLALAYLLIGCSTTSENDEALEAPVRTNINTITGRYTGAWASDEVERTGGIVLHITQGGEDLAGRIILDNTPCFGLGEFTGVLSSGEFSAIATNRRTLERIHLEGRLNGTRQINGEYHIANGLCDNDNGTFSVVHD